MAEKYPPITRERIEQLLRDAGHCINIVNGQCGFIEETLCRVTTLCCQLLEEMDEIQDHCPKCGGSGGGFDPALQCNNCNGTGEYRR